MKHFLSVLLALCALPAMAQRTGPTNITSAVAPNDCVSLSVNAAVSSTVYIDVDGTFNAILQPQVVRAGGVAKNLLVHATDTGASQATITAAGGYWAPVAATDTIKVCATTYTSGTASVSLTVGTGVASSGLGGGGGGSVTSLTSAGGITLTPDPIVATGTIALTLGGTANAPTYDNGAGALAEVSPPTTPNSVPKVYVSIPAGGVSTAPIWQFGGVPVDATNPATLLVTDRANFLDWTSGSALAIPANSGSFASNFPFVLRNTSGGDLTITPVGANIDGASTTVVHNNYAELVYNDNTNWKGIKFPAAATDGSISLTNTSGSTSAVLALAQTAQSTSTITPTLNATSTWNNGTTVFQGLVFNVTNTTSAASSCLFCAQSSGTTVWGVTPAGATVQSSVVESTGLQATGAASSITVAGGLASSNTAGAVGGVTVKGSDNSSTNAAAASGAATLRSGDLTGAATNLAANDLTIRSGNGRGNATPSHVLIQTPSFNLASGTTTQSTDTRYTYHVKAGSTTSATSTSLFNLALPSNSTANLMVTVSVTLISSTPNICGTTETFGITETNNNGAFGTANVVAGTTTTLCSAGTLTLAMTATGANPTVIAVTPTWATITSITSATISIEIHNLSPFIQDIAFL